MLPEQRRQTLMQTVIEQGGASIKVLSENFGVSEMTIRRDLQVLSDIGLVHLTHGGAIPAVSKRGSEQLYALKESANREAKAAIAQYAAEHFVDDNDVIIMDPGTTMNHMIPHLQQKSGLTVVTNGLHTINALKSFLPEATLVCTGGILRGVSDTFVGPTAEAYFDGFFATRYFISSVGVTAAEGLTDPQPLDTNIKRIMLTKAAEVIALLDSSKFGVRSTFRVASLSDVDTVITDPNADPEILRELGELTEVRVYENRADDSMPQSLSD